MYILRRHACGEGGWPLGRRGVVAGVGLGGGLCVVECYVCVNFSAGGDVILLPDTYQYL